VVKSDTDSTFSWSGRYLWDMENNLTRNAAQFLLGEYVHLIGERMPYPYGMLKINTIKIIKDKFSQGYTVMLTHEIFDGAFPDPDFPPVYQIDLLSFLQITGFSTMIERKPRERHNKRSY